MTTFFTGASVAAFGRSVDLGQKIWTKKGRSFGLRPHSRYDHWRLRDRTAEALAPSALALHPTGELCSPEQAGALRPPTPGTAPPSTATATAQHRTATTQHRTATAPQPPRGRTAAPQRSTPNTQLHP